MTLSVWKVFDAAVNIEKCPVKIKEKGRNNEAAIVSNNHRFGSFVLTMPYCSFSNVYELTRISNICPGR